MVSREKTGRSGLLKMQSRRAEIRHQRTNAVCPPPHKIRSHHGGVSCTRRRMPKRERCTFLLHLFSLAALNSFMNSRGTTLPPDFKVGEGSRKGGGRVINLRTSGAEIYDGLFRYLEYLAVGGVESRDVWRGSSSSSHLHLRYQVPKNSLATKHNHEPQTKLADNLYRIILYAKLKTCIEPQLPVHPL